MAFLKVHNPSRLTVTSVTTTERISLTTRFVLTATRNSGDTGWKFQKQIPLTNWGKISASRKLFIVGAITQQTSTSRETHRTNFAIDTRSTSVGD
jgi:hypothetical protein